MCNCLQCVTKINLKRQLYIHHSFQAYPFKSEKACLSTLNAFYKLLSNYSKNNSFLQVYKSVLHVKKTGKRQNVRNSNCKVTTANYNGLLVMLHMNTILRVKLNITQFARQYCIYQTDRRQNS